MAPALYYDHIKCVNELDFLNDHDKNIILHSIATDKTTYIRTKSNDSLVKFISSCTKSIAYVIKEIKRQRVVVEISKLIGSLGGTLKEVLLISDYNEQVWDAFLEFCTVVGNPSYIYPFQEMRAIPDGVEAWIVKQYKNLKIDQAEVRSFIKFELSKNVKNLELNKAKFDFEYDSAVRSDYNQLKDAIEFCIRHNVSVDFFSYAYIKLKNYPDLQILISKHARKAFPNSALAANAMCQEGYVYLQTKDRMEEVMSVLEKCHAMYKEALMSHADSEMHIYYLDFLNDLGSCTGDNVYDYYYNVLHLDMLRNVVAVGPEFVDFTTTVLKFLCLNGTLEKAKDFLAKSYRKCKEDSDKLAFLEKVVLTIPAENMQGILNEQDFASDAKAILQVVQLKKEYSKYGIKAARMVAKRLAFLWDAKPISLKELLTMELEQKNPSIKNIRQCHQAIIVSGTSNIDDYLGYIQFERNQKKYLNALSIYSYALSHLIGESKLEFKTALMQEEILDEMRMDTSE